MAERVKTSARIKNQRMPELVMAKLMDWIMDGTLSMGDKLVMRILHQRWVSVECLPRGVEKHGKVGNSRIGSMLVRELLNSLCQTLYKSIL